MLLPLLACFGGVLTILSPCILPVLPFVFARADRPFPRSGLPMLVGMAWAEKDKDQGLVVIGAHAPEFAFKEIGNVGKAVGDLGITYLVAIDNGYASWRSFKNQSWPAHSSIDAKGRIRHPSFGEGEYDASEHVIQQLLAEAGHTVGADVVAVEADGAQQASAEADVKSTETYVGASRGETSVSPGGAVLGAAHTHAPGMSGAVGDHTSEITFLDPGVRAFAFTFG